jgi:serine/threonine protein kinase
MEFCSGGDLFSYIERRGFRLPEPRAAQIIHKLSTAIFYLHSYGITHRDLKPENILMTDNSEEADIRLLDFGLSKIIGPNEFCNEPFGTLVKNNLLYSHMLLLKFF